MHLGTHHPPGQGPGLLALPCLLPEHSVCHRSPRGWTDRGTLLPALQVEVKISLNTSRIESCKYTGHKDQCLYLGSKVTLDIASARLTSLVNGIAFTLDFSVIERLSFRLRTSTSKWKMPSFALWNHSLVFMDYSQGLFVIEMIHAETKSNVKSPGNRYFIFQLLLSVASGKACTDFLPWEPKSINCYRTFLTAGKLGRTTSPSIIWFITQSFQLTVTVMPQKSPATVFLIPWESFS